MKQGLHAAVAAVLITTGGFAQNAFVHIEYQNFDFDHSLQKKYGERYVVHMGYQDQNAQYEAAYSKTDTKTFQPPLPDDLNVDKYYLKYTYQMDESQALSLSYATISDNIAEETDGGNIYGLSYRYGGVKLNQFISDYRHFNVYQTDLGYTFKYTLERWKFTTRIQGTYIHLQDRESNGFSAKAKEDYFTPSVMLQGKYDTYHLGAGAYFGKRIFAVMHDGFGVQHHAMEFDRTYMVSAGKQIGNFDVTLKYQYMRATEVPIENPDVTVDTFVLSVGYRF